MIEILVENITDSITRNLDALCGAAAALLLWLLAALLIMLQAERLERR